MIVCCVTTWSVQGHSDVIEGCVPTWSDISAECHSHIGVTWSVTRNTQPRAESHSHMVREPFLPWSDVRTKPFCHCERIGSFHGQMWVLSHSEVIVRCVLTWSDISTECHSLGEWRHLVSYQEFVQSGNDTQPGVESLSDMMCDEFPIMVRCKCRAFLTWILDVFLSWSNVSVDPFWHGCRIGSSHG